jgi:hypothetical protein
MTWDAGDWYLNLCSAFRRRRAQPLTQIGQDEDPDGGGEVLVASFGVNAPDQRLDRHPVPLGDFTQGCPEGLLEGNARPVAGDL